MILTKEAEVKLNSCNVEHYKSLGYKIPMKKASELTKKVEHKDYVYDFSKTILVKVKDLTNGSHSKIKALCDYCQNTTMTMSYKDYNKKTSFNHKIACKNCYPLKVKETSLMKYNVDNYAKTQQFLDAIHSISVDKYGADYFTQSPDVIKRRYETCLQRYGCINPMQSPEVRAKANETLCKNGAQKTSKQQLYLHSLYGGNINFPISYYAVDICFEKEKIAIEYDGGGHDLRVTLGVLTQEEFDNKEIIRNSVLKKEGYKRINIVSKSDLLPTDQILLQMLSDAKQYFSLYPEHSWIEFNIDTSTVRNAEHKDGVPYSFGSLRTIKDSNIQTSNNLTKGA